MIGICLGDVTGIGPEVTLKALAAEAGHAGEQFLLIGDGLQVARLSHKLGLSLRLSDYRPGDTASPIQVLNPSQTPLEFDLSPGSPAAARAAVEWLRCGAEMCLRMELDAIVTAPVNKESIVRAGIPFVGQTEFLTSLAGNPRTAMMLLGEDDRHRWLRVVLATTHLPLKLVPSELTTERVELCIEMAELACRQLQLPRARIGVCGLNPHAGEGGEFGDEEVTTIRPSVVAMRTRGVDVHGPYPADSLFYHAFKGEYEVVAAMYHDQGLAPMKMVAFETGVNWTLGLPFIRTSPDHGTAHDIAGKGIANASSMRAAIQLARQLAKYKVTKPVVP